MYKTLFTLRNTNAGASNRVSHRARRGTLTVEMAMIVPVIFLMFFGSLELARMMMVRQAVTNAAREGCRSACLATTQNSEKAEAVVRDSLDAVIVDVSTEGPLSVSITPDFSSTPSSGTTITVVAEVDFDEVSWLPPFFTAGAKIRGTASMKRE